MSQEGRKYLKSGDFKGSLGDFKTKSPSILSSDSLTKLTLRGLRGLFKSLMREKRENIKWSVIEHYIKRVDE